MHRVLGFLIARPVIAIVIAAVVVGVLLLRQTHEEKPPVTHRTEHVALSDAQQAQLGNQQYERHFGKTGRRSSRPAPTTSRSSGSPSASRPSPGATSPRSTGR
jgi:hypothetical protein